jgi:hypothetical protein
MAIHKIKYRRRLAVDEHLGAGEKRPRGVGCDGGFGAGDIANG